MSRWDFPWDVPHKASIWFPVSCHKQPKGAHLPWRDHPSQFLVDGSYDEIRTGCAVPGLMGYIYIYIIINISNWIVYVYMYIYIYCNYIYIYIYIHITWGTFLWSPKACPARAAHVPVPCQSNTCVGCRPELEVSLGKTTELQWSWLLVNQCWVPKRNVTGNQRQLFTPKQKGLM